MTTRKELILAKFSVLESKLKELINGDVFPSLSEIDIADLVYLVTLTFMGINTILQYTRPKLKN